MNPIQPSRNDELDLNYVFGVQKRITEHYSELDSSEAAKLTSIALMVELGEFMNETDFKIHKPCLVNKENLKDEAIDILAYSMQLLHNLGVSKQEVAERYYIKQHKLLNKIKK